MEFHHQLRKDSIDFHEDENGEYVTLNQETKEKNHQGGTTVKKECTKQFSG